MLYLLLSSQPLYEMTIIRPILQMKKLKNRDIQ